MDGWEMDLDQAGCSRSTVASGDGDGSMVEGVDGSIGSGG